jgi:hypothetical protein
MIAAGVVRPRGYVSIYAHLFKNAFDGVEEALDAVLASTSRQRTSCHHGARPGIIGCVISLPLSASARIWCARWCSWLPMVTIVPTYHI